MRNLIQSSLGRVAIILPYRNSKYNYILYFYHGLSSFLQKTIPRIPGHPPTDRLCKYGCSEAAGRFPEETDFYQPIVIAKINSAAGQYSHCPAAF
jgi:hypothetical protein